MPKHARGGKYNAKESKAKVVMTPELRLQLLAKHGRGEHPTCSLCGGEWIAPHHCPESQAIAKRIRLGCTITPEAHTGVDPCNGYCRVNPVDYSKVRLFNMAAYQLQKRLASDHSG